MRDRGAGHDGEGFAGIQFRWGGRGKWAGFDFSDHFQLRRKVFQIVGADGITIARGSGEGRDVAVGGDGFGEDAAGGVEQGYGFVRGWGYARGVVFDDAAGGFEAKYEGGGGRPWGDDNGKGRLDLGDF